jgi:hypothetical protein
MIRRNGPGHGVLKGLVKGCSQVLKVAGATLGQEQVPRVQHDWLTSTQWVLKGAPLLLKASARGLEGVQYTGGTPGNLAALVGHTCVFPAADSPAISVMPEHMIPRERG